MKQFFYYIIVVSVAMTTFLSCTKEDTVALESASMADNITPYVVSSPLHFDSLSSMASAMDLPMTKASNFVSYAETVMMEPGYDDLPYAILSTRFGTLLNAEGEVEFGDYLLKATRFGLLISPISDRELVVELAKNDNLLSICNNTTSCPDIKPDATFYKIDGFETILLFDSFNMKGTVSTYTPIETKSMSPSIIHDYRSTDLGLLADLTNGFTRPGEQKTKFSDTKYCNDTKIYQQNLLVSVEAGVKTKTMKKNSLGVWNKIDNQLEGGVTNICIHEEANFSHIDGSHPDINKVSYEGNSRIVYTVSARGMSINSIMGMSLSSKISEGNALANSHNISETIDGVRFVINDEEAITRFPNNTKSGTYDVIELGCATPFGGFGNWRESYILDNTRNHQRSYFYIVSVQLYGQSTRGSEVRGHGMRYIY